MSVGHSYYYSAPNPFFPRVYGEGLDDDPEFDGSDMFPVQATVLETGAASGYAFVEHVGPFGYRDGVGGGVW